ncbi:helix-turn-helix transcriptional regulator [Streptomyces sp. DH24]|uniref:helix-turn-helix transcriptional regulator n=1 Tax=Streptomyces sp. DH24 TaxID=3040123 RepID=UPI002442C17A|nr:helix-turn-helix transcriptional regulator [Streptomyces sp. DH24]MDG9715724.1 helix-turn-helix transcriptional regulator [Streptomyces sp. DH24]
MNETASGARSFLPETSHASLAENVSTAVREQLREAESAALRGRSDLGFATLRNALADVTRLADDDRIALAEMTSMLTRWGAPGPAPWAFLDELAAACHSPRARGAVFLAQARAARGKAMAEYGTRALFEFTAAGDIGGQALALSRMSFPADAGLSPSYRWELARRALALAKRSGEPWIIALVAGMHAACETYQGHKRAPKRWRRAASLLSADLDAVTGEVASLNYLNWALTCAYCGDYPTALEAVARGRVVGRGPWVNKFAAVEALVRHRTGDLDAARRQAEVAMTGTAPGIRELGSAVAAAVTFETARRLRHDNLEAVVTMAYATSPPCGASAAATLAYIRHARREPRPARGLPQLLRKARDAGHHFGWEDALLALTEIAPDAARDEAAAMSRFWSPHPRAVAIRAVVEGHLAGKRGWASLIEGADALAGMGEPITAGRAYHAAARVAPSPAGLAHARDRAAELLTAAGADRSLATLARDRSLHRGLLHVPHNQRHQVNAGLTPRERDVAVLAAQGFTAVEIAGHLGITVGTARNYVMNVRRKFGSVPKRRLAQVLGIVGDLD